MNHGSDLPQLDADDRRILNRMQDGMPISHAPFAEVAAELGLDETTLLGRLQGMLASGLLSRVGPMYRVEGFGGGLELAAMAVPVERFDAVADLLNQIPEVAHNYARDHRLNMWFVVATETPTRYREVIREIEAATGLTVYDMPKIREYFVGLRLEV